jgi:hypothetical protein
MKSMVRILLVVGALASASLACVINLGGPDLPQETIPVSPDVAAHVKEEVKIAVENARNGDGSLSVTLTEVDLTSLLADKLATQADPFITDPQVFLRDGQVKIYGKAHRGLFAATVGIVLSAGVNAEGNPELNVVSADFGPLPAPEGLSNTVTDFVNEAYTSALGPVATGFRLEAVSIQNGSLTLTGRLR